MSERERERKGLGVNERGREKNQRLILAHGGDKASSLWDRLISKTRHADFVAMVSIIQLGCFLIGKQGYRGKM